MWRGRRPYRPDRLAQKFLRTHWDGRRSGHATTCVSAAVVAADHLRPSRAARRRKFASPAARSPISKKTGGEAETRQGIVGALRHHLTVEIRGTPCVIAIEQQHARERGQDIGMSGRRRAQLLQNRARPAALIALGQQLREHELEFEGCGRESERALNDG